MSLDMDDLSVNEDIYSIYSCVNFVAFLGETNNRHRRLAKLINENPTIINGIING